VTVLHLDTHVLVWLYAGERARIPEAIQDRLEAEPLAISPMVQLELTYLHEVGRVQATAPDVLDEVGPALELQLSSAPFARVVQEAQRLTWTRDPFDRLIAAQAIVDGAVLVTADEALRGHVPNAIW
jgi:PIN domain nuclease of toxin-antitoxin system